MPGALFRAPLPRIIFASFVALSHRYKTDRMQCLGSAMCKKNLGIINMEVWYAFYDSMGGPGWTFCANLREDPCACQFAKHRVTCVSNYKRYKSSRTITEIYLPSANLRGVFPLNVFSISGPLEVLNISSSGPSAANVIALPQGATCVDTARTCKTCALGNLPVCGKAPSVPPTNSPVLPPPTNSPVLPPTPADQTPTTEAPIPVHPEPPGSVVDTILLLLVGMSLGLLLAWCLLLLRRNYADRIASYRALVGSYTEMSFIGGTGKATA